MESLRQPSTLLGNLFGVVSLVLEVSGLGVLVIDFIWDGVEGHSSFHEQGGNSSSKEDNEDIVVHDASMGGVTLEGQNVTLER